MYNKKVFLLAIIALIIFSIGMLYYVSNYKLISIQLTKRTTTKTVSLTQNVTKFTLENGLTTVIYNKKNTPNVHIHIAYHAGAANELPGEEGIAHIVEHMLFKGTKKLSESDIPAITRRYGAKTNAFTSYDQTNYFFETTSKNWDIFLEVMADCMQNAQFKKDHLASEIKTILQELKAGQDRLRKKVVLKTFNLCFPGNHPYHHPIIGYKDSLFNVTTEKIKNFYHRYYQPNNAILFIMGNVDVNNVKNKVEKYFSNIQNQTKIKRPNFPHLLETSTHNTNAQIFTNQKQRTLNLFWTLVNPSKEDCQLLSAAATIIGKGGFSKLHKNLVDKHKVASHVQAKTIKLEKAAIMLITVKPLPGKIISCKKLIQQELRHIVETSISPEDISYIKKRQQLHFFKLHEKPKNFIAAWSKSYFITGDIKSFLAYNTMNNYLTKQKLQTFIQKHLNPITAGSISTTYLPRHLRKKASLWQHMNDQYDKQKIQAFKRVTPKQKPKYLNHIEKPKYVGYQPPKPDTITQLDNGLTIITKYIADAPMIHIQCRFNNANYTNRTLEGKKIHLMMKSLLEQSKQYSKKEHVSFLSQYGSSYSFSKFGASVAMLSDHYHKITKRFLHILMQPTFPQKSLQKYKRIYHNHLQQKMSNVNSKAQSIFNQTIYKNHPYGWAWKDALAAIDNITQKDLIALHSKHVTPNNLTIALVGNIDTQEAITSIKNYTQNWLPTKQHTSPPPSHISYTKQQLHKAYSTNQSILMYGAPSTVTPTNKNYISLQLLNYICFSSLGSKLYNLREEKGLFYNATGGWARQALSPPGYNFIKITTSPYNIKTAKHEITKMLHDIQNKGISKQNLETAKEWFRRQVINKFDAIANIAKTFCTLHTSGLNTNYYETALKSIEKIRAEDISALCKQQLDPELLSIISIGREAKKL